MAPRIVFIGAGSIGFTRKLVGDLLAVPELRASELVFMDIDAKNLERTEQLVQKDLAANELPASTLQTTTDRREALRDADYVFSTVRIGGLEAFATDVEVPLAFGVDQCVGDTLSAGGIMYGQRNIPFILDLAKDISSVAKPDCLFLNYANPMAMNVWAAHHYGKINVVGLCHGVQGGHSRISQVLGVPKEELHYVCAGINHQTWFVELVHNGRDMTGELLDAFERWEGRNAEKVRIDMLRRFGYFSTESNGHLSEYLAWYRKRPEEIHDWIGTESWAQGETGGYLRICREWRNYFDAEFPHWLKEPAHRYGPKERTHEHGSWIIEARETGRLYRGHFNMVNNGAIENLPEESIVEGPGLVDGTGIRLLNVGELPHGPAAVCKQSIEVQRLSVEAAVTGDDKLLRQAMMMDPLVSATCTPPEIWEMVDEMLVAQAAWLPQYGDAIGQAQKRVDQRKKAGRSMGTERSSKGAYRVQVRSNEELAAERASAQERPDEE